MGTITTNNNLDVEPMLKEIEKLQDKNFSDQEALKKYIQENIIKNDDIQVKVTEVNLLKEATNHKFKITLSTNDSTLVLKNNRPVEISVKFGQAENLNEVITERNLGKLENSEQDTIIDKLVEKNSNLKKQFICITTVQKTDAVQTLSYKVKVSSVNSDVYVGEVDDVEFTANEKFF